MKTEVKTTTILTADNGMMLTNGNTYARRVVLGVGDSPENWHEITKEEYNAVVNREMEREA